MNASSKTLAAALTLALPVGLELLLPQIGDVWWGHLLFVTSQVVGWSLLLTVCRELRTATAAGPSRPRRVGSRMVAAACGLQVLFALLYAASFALTGEGHTVVWVTFSVAFLLLTAGGLLWGVSLRRAGLRRPSGTGLVLVAGLGLAALLVGADPWHDAALLSSYLSWVLVGRGLSSEPPTLSAPARRQGRAGASQSA